MVLRRCKIQYMPRAAYLQLPARLGGARLGVGHVAAELGAAGAFRRQQLVGIIYTALHAHKAKHNLKLERKRETRRSFDG